MNAIVDFGATARAEPLVLHGLDDLCRHDRDAATFNWRMRMVSEHVSARVFAALVEQLIRANVAAHHVRAVSAMIDQELRHAELCARVVVALGGDPIAELPQLAEVPRHDDVPAIVGALRNVISISCCSETVAVALVGMERELAATPELRGVLTEILADEVRHARFGWSLLDELGPHLDDDHRRHIDAYLPSALRHQIDFYGAFVHMDEVSDEALSIGAADGATNWRIFLDTIDNVTVPGLERAGLHAGHAWREAIEDGARHITADRDWGRSTRPRSTSHH